jgi:hypothetical protein
MVSKDCYLILEIFIIFCFFIAGFYYTEMETGGVGLFSIPSEQDRL